MWGVSKVSCFLIDMVHWTLIQVDPLIDKDHLEILNLKIPFRLACVEKSVSNIFRGPVWHFNETASIVITRMSRVTNFVVGLTTDAPKVVDKWPGINNFFVRAHTHIDTHSHTRTLTHNHTHAHWHTITHTHIVTHSHTRTLTHPTLSPTHARSHTQPHTRASKSFLMQFSNLTTCHE